MAKMKKPDSGKPGHDELVSSILLDNKKLTENISQLRSGVKDALPIIERKMGNLWKLRSKS